jgi:hypothetical protein
MDQVEEKNFFYSTINFSHALRVFIFTFLHLITNFIRMNFFWIFLEISSAI